MESIKVSNIEKNDAIIRISFEVTENLKQFFSENEFIVEYEESITRVPDAIAVIPFICSVIPIIWITDSKLAVKELDESFYYCLQDVKKGYEKMYPESEFKGELEIEHIVKCNQFAVSGKAAMFYSAGADSMATLYQHLDEKPALISIWGSDIDYDNEDGWKIMHAAIREAADHFHLEETVIHSRFRKFDSEKTLTRVFSSQLKDNWWHGVKHGIALLGHVAPYAYLHGIEKMYIASSNCLEDKDIRCASNPLIDNYVRFANCRVYHDGFEFSRQDKISNIVKFSKENNEYLPLHVCWKTQTGTNCCHCEKCYRTISAILIENGDPAKFGFEDFDLYLKDMQLAIMKEKPTILRNQWTKIQKGLLNNKKTVRKSPYWKELKWIKNADFYHPVPVQKPLMVRLKKAKGIRGKLAEFTFYQKLHEWKEKRK